MMNERLIGAEASFSQKKGPRSRWVGRLSAATPKGAARSGSERVYLPDWLLPRKQIERATLPQEGPSRVGVPNCTGLVPGSYASLRHATEKSC